MDFGFINIAAPASQPAPLTDSSVSPDLCKDAAAAFDAALAATLGGEDVKADRGTAAAAGRVGQQPAWLFASLLAPTATAFDVATETVTATEDLVPADGDSITADAAADDESSDEPVALPVEMAIAIPVVAEIKPSTSFGPANPVVLQGGPVVEPHDGVTSVVVEQAPSKAAVAHPRVAAAGFENAAAAGRVQSAGSEGAAAAGRVPSAVAAYAGKTSAVPVNGPDLAAAPDAPVAQGAAGKTGVAPMKAGVDPLKAGVDPLKTGVDPLTAPVEHPFGADALTGIATDQRETQAAVKTAVPRPELPTVAAQRTENAQNVAATTAVANAIAAVADQAVAQAAPATTTAVRTEPGETGDVPRLAVSWQAHSGQDAPMTGQEQQGQGRQSPEFTRFAAALAQVTSAGVEDGGRAATAVVAPVTPTATAAAGVTATVATAPTAPTAAAETPAAENVGRLVQAMRVISRPGAWEANVRLKPEHLGEVNISVRVERNTVSAVVNAEAAGVRQWLESQEQTVRSGMAEHGLHLERFVVQRDGQRRDAEPHSQQESRRQSPRRQAPTERFEIVV